VFRNNHIVEGCMWRQWGM